MNQLETIVKDSFKLLNGFPTYISIEEKESYIFEDHTLENTLKTLVSWSKEKNLQRISALINRSTDHYTYLSQIFKNFGFEKYASRVEVYRNLTDLNDHSNGYEWRGLADSSISEEEFKRIWHSCMAGSENAASTLTIDEHLFSVKSELGDHWKESCKAIFEGEKPIGISIPHIEPGTINEGRLFYFGLVPEERGKGKSTLIHLQSLHILIQMGATYYIGSTHETNKGMQKVFMKNGCSIKAHTESYYKYLK